MSATKRPLVVAHRGGAGLAPENTLAAFRNALELQVDAVELDVHLSKDGVPVVLHDPDVSRATGAVGEVEALTLVELQQLDAAATYKGADVGMQRIPTLAEVLALIQGHSGVQIEIKLRGNKQRYPGIERQVVETVRHSNMVAETVVLSFDFPTLLEVQRLEPTLRTCALVSSGYLSRFDIHQRATLVTADLAAQGFRCVGSNHTWLSPALFQALRDKGFEVGVWTVNDLFSMRKFIDMGVNFITSDLPNQLRDLLR